MTRQRRHLSFLLLSLLLLAPSQLVAQPAGTSIIVKLTPAAAKAAAPAQTLLQLVQHAVPAAAIRAIQPVYPGLQTSPLDRTFTIDVDDDASSQRMLEVLAGRPDIEYIQRNHVFQVRQTAVNDSLFDRQWGLMAINAVAAWAISTGAPSVPVAVIDTGIDYNHPDLRFQLWINPGEDLNGNGIVDPEDFNGLDDDGNGFVDDIFGWDFTDAPNFVDGGDYLERDNDPFDEHGHGTAVAGIIAAQANNRIGIAGAAPNCVVMNLRAGTSMGYLEEDDVAAAIVYAIQNGARVINMSFGDIVVTPMLRDVIRFAHEHGVVLVASAGNSASSAPHYPSGFAETISVGAISENRNLANFSNFGSTIDLVAPGVAIWSTQRNGGYGTFAGTSASAPFVSAVAGLLLSHEPELTPAQVRSRLTSSAVDLGEPGWDARFGAGLVDAAAALQAQHTSIAAILEPAMDAGFAAERLAIIGTASGALLHSFRLSYGIGDLPAVWTDIAEVRQRQVVRDTLAIWRTGVLPDGSYMLRLQLFHRGGQTTETRTRVMLDRTPPHISDVAMLPLIDADQPSVLISFTTDDASSATIHWRPCGGDAFQARPLRFVTSNHREHLIRREMLADCIEFFIEATNSAGLHRIDDNGGAGYRYTFDSEPIFRWSFDEAPGNLPGGLLLPALFDLDGMPAIAMSVYESNRSLGPLTIFTPGEHGFEVRHRSPDRAIPRDARDLTGDGRPELLAGLGPNSFIFGVPDGPGQTLQEIWRSGDDFWAARFADLDGDGQIEIIARRSNEWQVWQQRQPLQFDFAAALPNPTPGSNILGVPRAEIGDFDGDGKAELLFGDYDGDIFIYEADGDNRFTNTWSTRLPLIDAADFIKAGDFDGDGQTDFAVAVHSDPALNFEHEFDARRWLVRIYRGIGDNDFEIAWEQAFFGFFSPRDFDAGLGAGDLNGDGADELVLSLFPDLYIIAFDRERRRFRPVWHFRTARSNTALIGDFGDGRTSLLFNEGDRLARFLPAGGNGLPAPVNLDAYALDAGRVRLSWAPVTAATGYRLYRGLTAGNLQVLAQSDTTRFVDATVTSDTTYLYAVTALAASEESRPSRVVEVTPQAGPALLSATFVPATHVTLLFSAPLGESAKNAANYTVAGIGHPASVVLATGEREAILTYPGGLPPGSHTVSATRLAGIQRTPLDSRRRDAVFTVPASRAALYLRRAALLDDQRLHLQFSQPLDPLAAADTSHYRFSTPLQVQTAALDAAGDSVVVVGFAGPAAAFGREHTVTVRGLRSAAGATLSPGEGDAAAFMLVARELVKMSVYPNPFRPAEHGEVKIAGLPPQTMVQVLDETGRLICELRETSGAGRVAWDGRDSRQRPVASGIYLLRATTGGRETYAKIALLR